MPTLPPLDSKTYLRLSTLQKACSNAESLQKLLDAGADPNQHFDFNHLTRPLHCAVNTRSLESLKLLLACGADPMLDDGHGSPLSKAVSYAHNGPSHRAVVEELLNSPLIRAAADNPIMGDLTGVHELVPLFAQKGFNPNALRPTTSFAHELMAKKTPTCLGYGISRGIVDADKFVLAMINVGANPNGDEGGVSPLACALGMHTFSSDGVLALLAVGGDPRWRLSPILDCGSGIPFDLTRQERFNMARIKQAFDAETAYVIAGISLCAFGHWIAGALCIACAVYSAHGAHDTMPAGDSPATDADVQPSPPPLNLAKELDTPLNPDGIERPNP